MNASRFFSRGLLSCVLFAFAATAAAQTQPIDGVDARADTTALGRQLGSVDANVRQRAAEALARLAATDQKKLIEGYYIQEKNKPVRLALEWALYRIGKEEALYRIVRDLDSGRHDQAVGYLTQLDSPDVLYPFLKRDDNKPRVLVGLLEALGQIGNAETRPLIEQFRDSFTPGVAAAAEKAIQDLDARMGQPEGTKPTRPRSVSKPDQPTP
jgi:HEAT repeat protein